MNMAKRHSNMRSYPGSGGARGIAAFLSNTCMAGLRGRWQCTFLPRVCNPEVHNTGTSTGLPTGVCRW